MRNGAEAALENEGSARIYGISFDFDQATLKPASEPALRQLLDALRAKPELRMDIEGHIDSAGDDAYDLSLSERRAQTVAAWLARNGVEPARLEAVGKGQTAPVADGRALNRRVEARRRQTASLGAS